ncbi:MAG TPA: hypothetical protein ENN90_05785 [Mariniphaga anaerophila]|uniref:Uncharacterized protein n=1 Tax=Mariniphaga anaerophila TaxID=1484053 RepID=A0A831LKA6_9BACT|nr:hypothetical protein [Mariniphaga anaerophila]
MDSKNEDVIKAAGRIIVMSGTQALTINTLFREPEIKGKSFLRSLKDDEDIYEILLLNFEIELIELIGGISVKCETPDKELELLFKRLYVLFKKKPWNLALIFDNNLSKRYKWFDKSIFRIKNMAKNYLTDLIDRGKKEKVFATSEDTKILVRYILSSFSSLRNDYQLGWKIIADLKNLQSTQD